jgi:hypothetical protein
VLAWLFPILLLITGPVLVVVGLHIRAQERPEAGWTTTTGTVVGVRRDSGIRGDDVDRPVVSFADRTGTTHRFAAPSGSDPVRLGSAVRVAYDPHNPREARDLSAGGWGTRVAVGVALTAVGALAAAVATGLRVHRRRARAPATGSRARPPGR